MADQKQVQKSLSKNKVKKVKAKKLTPKAEPLPSDDRFSEIKQDPRFLEMPQK